MTDVEVTDTPAEEGMQARIGRLLDEVEAMPATGSPGGDASTPLPDATAASTVPDSAPGIVLPGGLPLNPELLAALPRLMNLAAPLLKNLGGMSRGTAPGSHAKKAPPNRHTALIRALKPYLSPERRQAAETVLELLEVWDTLSDMGISFPALTGGQSTVSAEGGGS